MKITYAQESLEFDKNSLKIFLAGPTPREDSAVGSWRPHIANILSASPYANKINLLVPEPATGSWQGSYMDQVEWEEEAIGACDILVFWVARDIKNGMPGFTTNVEFGWWLDKKSKIILGYPLGAEKCRYLGYKFTKHFPNEHICTSFEEIVMEIEKHIVVTNMLSTKVKK